MTQRPFLERASWVAGIASAAIAAIIWLKPSAPEQTPTVQKPAQRAPAPISKGSIDKPVTESSSPQIKPSANTRWACEGVASDLQPAFEAAKNISYTASKDTAFLSLARKALCFENYQMFEEAAKQIDYTGQRDRAYGDAVDFTLGIRKFALAEKYASNIAYTGTRDSARARIVAKSSER